MAKISFISPPLIWVAIYICKNNLTCILSSFVKRFQDCLFLYAALKTEKMLFFIGVSRVTVQLITVESRNSWNCFLPSEYRLLTAHTTSWLIISLIPSWYNSFLPSSKNGLPSCSNSATNFFTLESNFFWKLSDFSWWWNSVYLFPLRIIAYSNSSTILATSGLRTCQRLNFLLFSVNPTNLSSPEKKYKFRKMESFIHLFTNLLPG